MAGIKVPGSFVPGTVKGYVTESKWVKGTYIVVQDLDEKELLPTNILVDGTRIYVVSEDREYRWASSDWVPLPKGFFDAPVDGRVYARQNGNWTEVKFDTTNIEQQIQDLYTQVSSKADADSVVSIQEFTAFQEQIEHELLNYVTQEELESYTQMQIVQELPVTGNSDTIYFLSIDNHWEINIWYNNQYITVTSSDVDLSNYYTKEETENLVYEVENKIPTTTNQLTNDSGFITKSVDDLDNYYTSTTVDGLLADKADNSDIPDVSNLVTNNELVQSLESKQDTLVSGTTIKTINGQNIMGSGNLEVEATEVSSDAVSNALDELYGQSSTGDNTLILDGNS